MKDDEITQPSSVVDGAKTASLPAISPEMVALTLLGQTMSAGFRETNANIALVSSDLSLVKDRVALLETERTKHSGGLRGLSTSNAEQDAQLAQERMAREALAAEVAAIKAETSTQTLLLGQLLKLGEKPVVKLIATAVGTAILTWLSTKGIHQ